MWNEFLPISMPITAIAICAVVAMACSCLGAPGQLIAGGAGARPDHPITGLARWIRRTGVTEYLLCQSALILAARIALPHFSVSSAMSLPKSADEPASVVAPRSARRAFVLGSARPALISLLSL